MHVVTFVQTYKGGKVLKLILECERNASTTDFRGRNVGYILKFNHRNNKVLLNKKYFRRGTVMTNFG